jgi:DNA-binding winged helix-turn-helix (wHTH) protein/DNA-binding CsgD family transcriptional regulator
VPDLVIDERRRSVYRGGDEIQLTPQEYRLLHCLGRNGGEVVSKPDLLAAMWSTTEATREESLHFDPAAVDLVIFRLRQKLGDNAHTPTYIETRRGFGYILHHAQIVPSLAARTSEPSEQEQERSSRLAAQANSATEQIWNIGPGVQAWSTLTRREWELFLLLGDQQTTRLTNRALAQQLQMAEGTLKKHLQHIYDKLGVENRASAALLAMQVKVFFANE